MKQDSVTALTSVPSQTVLHVRSLAQTRSDFIKYLKKSSVMSNFRVQEEPMSLKRSKR